MGASTPISSSSPTPLGSDRSRTSPSMTRMATKSRMAIVADLATPDPRSPTLTIPSSSEEAGAHMEGPGWRDRGADDGADDGSGELIALHPMAWGEISAGSISQVAVNQLIAPI